MEQLGLVSEDAYLERLRGALPNIVETELRNLLNLVTVTETCFFRDTAQFRLFRELIVPALITGRSPNGDRSKKIRIWSAGCSSGDEAYSIAITLDDMGIYESYPDWTIEIVGTDLNSEALEKARRGMYSPRAVRNVEGRLLDKYFVQDDRSLALKDFIKRRVNFEFGNLTRTRMPSTGLQDVVFCKNVAIYFRGDVTRKLIDGIRDTLAPGGYLLLGHAESLWHVSEDFALVEYQRAFCYRKSAQENGAQGQRDMRPALKGWATGAAGAPALKGWATGAAGRPALKGWATGAASAPALKGSATGADTSADTDADGETGIKGWATSKDTNGDTHADETTALKGWATDAYDTPSVAQGFSPVRADAATQYDSCLAAFRAGDWNTAESQLVALVDACPTFVPGLLLLGGLYAHRGRFEDAMAKAETALNVNDLEARAHLLLGMIAARRGRAEEALQSLRRALYLDDALALGHFWLGNLYRERGDIARACQEYENVVRDWERHALQLTEEFASDLTAEQLVAFCSRTLDRLQSPDGKR